MTTPEGRKGLEIIAKRLENAGKQERFASIVAATRTANLVKAALTQEMERVFDRPTPYTLRSLRTKPATKSDPAAEVALREFGGKGSAAPDYLLPQIYGGGRVPKRSERHLRRAGHLGPGEFIVPSKSVLLNRYGNIARGRMTKILSHLQAHFDPQQNTPARGRLQYFVGRPGRGPLGVWERKGKKISPVLIFVDDPQYRQRLDFYGVGRAEADRVYAEEFITALEQARATAK